MWSGLGKRAPAAQAEQSCLSCSSRPEAAWSSDRVVLHAAACGITNVPWQRWLLQALFTSNQARQSWVCTSRCELSKPLQACCLYAFEVR